MRAAVVMVVVSAASWGLWSLFLRPAGLPATVSAPIMFATTGIAALPLALREPSRARWDRRAVWLLLAYAVLDAGNVLTYFAALSYTTVAIAVLTHYLAPIFVALAAGVIDGESPRGTRPAAAVALVGLAIVLEPWRAPAAGAIVGALLGVTSAACYAAYVFIVRRLAVQIGPSRAVAYHSLIGAVLLIALLLVPFGGRGLGEVSFGSAGRIAIGAVLLGALANVLFSTGLAKIGAARTAVLCFAEPLVAVAVGVIVWHEPLRPLAAAGGVLVIAAGVHVARQT